MAHTAIGLEGEKLKWLRTCCPGRLWKMRKKQLENACEEVIGTEQLACASEVPYGFYGWEDLARVGLVGAAPPPFFPSTDDFTNAKRVHPSRNDAS